MQKGFKIYSIEIDPFGGSTITEDCVIARTIAEGILKVCNKYDLTQDTIKGVNVIRLPAKDNILI